MTAPAIPVIIDTFDDLMERVRRAINRLRDGVQDCIDDATRFINWLPRAVADRIVQLCQELRQAWLDFCDAIDDILEESGDPRAVWGAGAAWSAAFAAPLAGHAGDINFDNLAGDYHWDGRASDAYIAAAEKQKGELEAFAGIGTDLHSALGDIAVGIVALWGSIMAGLLMAVSSILAAALSVIGGVTAPAGLVLAIAAVGALCAGVATGIMGFMLCVERANDGMSTLKPKLDQSKGDWPMSNTSRFNDGKVWAE